MAEDSVHPILFGSMATIKYVAFFFFFFFLSVEQMTYGCYRLPIRLSHPFFLAKVPWACSGELGHLEIYQLDEDSKSNIPHPLALLNATG